MEGPHKTRHFRGQPKARNGPTAMTQRMRAIGMTTGEAIQDITAGTFANGPAWRGAADEACRGERFACIGKQLDLSRPSSTFGRRTRRSRGRFP